MRRNYPRTLPHHLNNTCVGQYTTNGTTTKYPTKYTNPGTTCCSWTERPARPVHIKLRPPPITNRHHHPSRQRRTYPASPVITQPPDQPQQQQRRHHMKQAEQPDPQRNPRIEHELTATNEMPAVEQRARQVNRVKRLEK